MASITPLQTIVLERPYSIEARLTLARQYAALGYPDLSAGEAYMALLLIDEVRDDSGEYHEEAFETAQEDIREDPQAKHDGNTDLEEQEVINWAQGRVECETYDIVSSHESRKGLMGWQI
jgi:hypothetical protein